MISAFTNDISERNTSMSICDNISVGKNGHLYFAGQDTVDLAKQYGTPST